MEKQQLIRRLSEKHPSYGVERGWSWYIGGMTDDGNWYHNKLSSAPEIELQQLLDEIIAIENKPEEVLTDEEKQKTGVIIQLKNGMITNQLEYEKLTEVLKEAHTKAAFNLLFGRK